MIPPERKMTVENNTARVAVATCSDLVAEQERDHDGGKHLKESFDPEVDDPPAPVFGHHEMTNRAAVPADPRQQRHRVLAHLAPHPAAIVAALPLYVMFQQAGLLDTLPALVITYVAANLPSSSGSSAITSRRSHMELEECGTTAHQKFRIFCSIVLPISYRASSRPF